MGYSIVRRSFWANLPILGAPPTATFPDFPWLLTTPVIRIPSKLLSSGAGGCWLHVTGVSVAAGHRDHRECSGKASAATTRSGWKDSVARHCAWGAFENATDLRREVGSVSKNRRWNVFLDLKLDLTNDCGKQFHITSGSIKYWYLALGSSRPVGAEASEQWKHICGAYVPRLCSFCFEQMKLKGRAWLNPEACSWEYPKVEGNTTPCPSNYLWDQWSVIRLNL